MFDLADFYYIGKGTEKNLEKSFHWYQKAAENDHEEAMLNLFICYENGEGTEKDSEKAFYWYKKAAENAAENGVKYAMLNLSSNYDNGEGTKKNLEKAFYWYQKVAENAENGDKEAINNLVAICYENGEGTEKDLEKAFYLYQKAAEDDHIEAMINLANIYENGKGMEKDFEKAFYWYQKAVETQLNAKNSHEILEWIPYNKSSNINYYDKGGFSEIYKAFWSDGPIYSWNIDKKQWIDKHTMSKFLDKWKYHYNCQKKSFSKFIQFFGITHELPYNDILISSNGKSHILQYY
ncbi:Ack1p [Rhizophagus irregularis DAOM 197198w]|uniref:Ack1p n=1 Tax=Rhizophagus irregularis (strain DAOM 197198w) TaxID=1432141 RepID=A0A015IDZ2_RHIIW|nr:Ack1p [Rhizophagus irregularis DAOM 197198w]